MRSILLSSAIATLAACASIAPPPASQSIAGNYVSANGTCRIQIPGPLGTGFNEFFPPDERLLIVGSMDCEEGTCRLIDTNRQWGGQRLALRITAAGAITGRPVSLSHSNAMLGAPRATPESCRFIPARSKITDPTQSDGRQADDN